MTDGLVTITVTVERFDPSTDKAPRLQEYEVPISPEGTTVLNALHYIYENLDPTLAYYGSCRFGVCGGCMVVVNGQTCLACCKMIAEDFLVKPVPTRKLVRDLYTLVGPVGVKEGDQQ